MILGIGFGVSVLFLTVIMLWPKGDGKEEGFNQKVITWQNRIKDAVGGPEKKTAADFDSSDDQMVYSKIAIASSHLIGGGPGNSIQRDYIPHADSDYIYAVIIEELGLIGGILVMLLYMTILYRSGRIASKCDDPYPAYLVMGIGMIIVIQAMMHMFVSVSTFVTGQPLPLLSKGGTSVIINCINIGFMLSISRYAKKASDKSRKETAEAVTAEPAATEESGEKENEL
jgi:cell division protein FtsW